MSNTFWPWSQRTDPGHADDRKRLERGGQADPRTGPLAFPAHDPGVGTGTRVTAPSDAEETRAAYLAITPAS
ncbi:hypothetical protein ElP_49500 [Tautonia plasticadhaerens]|uniref:Uncharacterized protein n=1 Tax=Tautonia plasticadhaerens TaxID=2527974 RepID=A0A518H828_9BACT|nr:hypothetical protein ElP_49500 [Tautonia plasticadhaerens]